VANNWNINSGDEENVLQTASPFPDLAMESNETDQINVFETTKAAKSEMEIKEEDFSLNITKEGGKESLSNSLNPQILSTTIQIGGLNHSPTSVSPQTLPSLKSEEIWMSIRNVNSPPPPTIASTLKTRNDISGSSLVLESNKADQIDVIETTKAEKNEMEIKPEENFSLSVTKEGEEDSLSNSLNPQILSPTIQMGGLNHSPTPSTSVTPQTLPSLRSEEIRTSIRNVNLPPPTVASTLKTRNHMNGSSLVKFFNQLTLKVSDLLFPKNTTKESVNMETWKVSEDLEDPEPSAERSSLSAPKTFSSKTSTHMPLSFLTFLPSPSTETATNGNYEKLTTNSTHKIDRVEETTLPLSLSFLTFLPSPSTEIATNDNNETTKVSSTEIVEEATLLSETFTTTEDSPTTTVAPQTTMNEMMTPPFTTVSSTSESISLSSPVTNSPIVTFSTNSSTKSQNFLEFLAKLEVSGSLAAPVKPTSLPRQKVRTIPPSKLPRLDTANETKASHWHDWSLYWVTSTEPQPRNSVSDRRKLPRIDDEEGKFCGLSFLSLQLRVNPSLLKLFLM